MKKLLSAVLLGVLLSGCSGADPEMERVLELRSKVQHGALCEFEAEVSADYGDRRYQFDLDCQADSSGDLTFTVTEPESIAGITGTISEEGGKLTFDGTALQFDKMADGQISPVTAPWIFLRTLNSGYITSVGAEEEGLRISLDDSYEDDALHVDIWLGEKDVPQRFEIVYHGQRILSGQVEDFQIR